MLGGALQRAISAGRDEENKKKKLKFKETVIKKKSILFLNGRGKNFRLAFLLTYRSIAR